MTGDFDPFVFREDLFRVARGESRPQPEHGYLLIEMMRYAKLGLDKRFHQIPKGKRQKFFDLFKFGMDKASLIEIYRQAELRLLDSLLNEKCINEIDYNSKIKEIEIKYNNQVADEANTAAIWLSQILIATEKRKKGRPSKKIIPDNTDYIDEKIILLACTAGHPQFDKEQTLQRCLLEIPNAVKAACDAGVLVRNTHPDIVADSKQYEAHVKRIRAKATRWLGD